MCIVVNKVQVAIKQLNTAISLYYSSGDIISIHTLAGAAHNIIHDLVENKYPNKSWENTVAQDNNLSLGKFLQIARKAQNFIKHAKTDPDGDITINSNDTEHLLFLTIQNLCLLIKENELLSNEVSTFQLWFMATHNYTFHENYLNDEFKDIKNMTKKEQIEQGKQLLLAARNNA